MANTKAKILPSTNGEWADSLDQWRGRRLHKVVMPSGAKAVIQIPDVAQLVLTNQLPPDLLVYARASVTHDFGIIGAYADQMAELDEKAPEDMDKAKDATEKLSHLLKELVANHILVEPKITVADLADESFPMQDLDWLYGVATRRVDRDAIGRRLGVALLDDLATFPSAHGCEPDCPHCVEALQALSTADLGPL